MPLKEAYSLNLANRERLRVSKMRFAISSTNSGRIAKLALRGQSM